MVDDVYHSIRGEATYGIMRTIVMCYYNRDGEFYNHDCVIL